MGKDILEMNYARWLEKYWMSVTAMKDGKVNSMTAGWGTFGMMWSRPCVCIAIRPQRYTYEFVEAADYLSLNFFSKDKRKELSYLGTVSGRDEDKIKKLGWHVLFDEDVPYFKEAEHNLICRKCYGSILEEDKFYDFSIVRDIYPKKDWHKIYICELKKVISGDKS